MSLRLERKYEHGRSLVEVSAGLEKEWPGTKSNTIPCKIAERVDSSVLIFEPSTRYATCWSLNLAAAASMDEETISASSDNIANVRSCN